MDYALARADLPRRLKFRARRPIIVLLAPEDAAAYRAACLEEEGADACVAKTSLGTDLPRLLAELAPPGDTGPTEHPT